ncbi:hypothetical protein [Bacillus sp. KH172YL63]|uniref:hypothetical protein n=1 Tax=Bacillus sp. KH172YL63 TaxID=2709784 RepID=UPI0013E4CEB9|nr:hypothetical protein [Bacillus sp. KH172YL63]BCB03974.1 hypothetical protein KH172YL63_21070 [Bacillus sp. KH172YL63]
MIISFKPIVWLLLALLLIGCANDNQYTDIKNDELLVKHWEYLDEERKIALIKEVLEEDRIHISDQNFKESKQSILALFDKGLELTHDRENNLKHSMIAFYQNRDIPEEN